MKERKREQEREGREKETKSERKRKRGETEKVNYLNAVVNDGPRAAAACATPERPSVQRWIATDPCWLRRLPAIKSGVRVSAGA